MKNFLKRSLRMEWFYTNLPTIFGVNIKATLKLSPRKVVYNVFCCHLLTKPLSPTDLFAKHRETAIAGPTKNHLTFVPRGLRVVVIRHDSLQC